MASRGACVVAYAMLCGIWGSTWLVIRIGLQGAPPFLAAGLRFVIASLVLLTLAAVFRSKLPMGRTEWGLIALFGVILFTVDYGLIYWAENRGLGSGLSAILFATMPLQTALLAHAILRNEPLTIPRVVGILVGFAGVLLVFRGEFEAAGLTTLFPMLAIIVSATCAALATVAAKRWGHGIDVFTFNGFAMGIGSIGLLAWSAAAAEPWAVPSWPAGILSILYLSLVASVVAFGTYVWLLRKLPATSMSYIALVTPVIAVFLGVAIAGEAFDPLAIAGAAIILSGIYLSTSRRAVSWIRNLMGAGVVPEATNAGLKNPKR